MSVVGVGGGGGTVHLPDGIQSAQWGGSEGRNAFLCVQSAACGDESSLEKKDDPVIGRIPILLLNLSAHSQ